MQSFENNLRYTHMLYFPIRNCVDHFYASVRCKSCSHFVCFFKNRYGCCICVCVQFCFECISRWREHLNAPWMNEWLLRTKYCTVGYVCMCDALRKCLIIFSTTSCEFSTFLDFSSNWLMRCWIHSWARGQLIYKCTKIQKRILKTVLYYQVYKLLKILELILQLECIGVFNVWLFNISVSMNK